MRLSFMAAGLIAAFSITAGAMAQPAPAGAPAGKVSSGEMVYSSDGAALGRIDYVQKSKDGAVDYVAVIRNMRMVHIPAATISSGPNGLVTSLTKVNVDKLN